jgi:adenylylsulfate kinase
MEKNVFKQGYRVTKADRNKKNKHHSFLIWFTGLSGSGKSTIANQLEALLFEKGISTYVLDGDNIRMGLNKDLSFTEVDRTENIRRISEVANLMIDAGLIVLAAFVSPYRKDRESIRQLVKDANFVEIFVDASLETCEQRDVKGLYKKARAGEIKNLTGLNAPYEAPQNPDIVIKTDEIGVQEAAQKVFQLIAPKLKINDE